MDNIILSGMLKDFSTRHGFGDETIDKQFEKFANFCVLRADHYDSFEFEKVNTGDCVGIDGIAVSIGGVIVNELDDATQLTKGQFDVKFFFCQAKTSPRFDLGDFLKFVSTVQVFFGDDLNKVPSQLRAAFSVKQLIYERASKLRGLPTVELSYVYSGRFDLESSGIAPQINAAVESIRAIPYRFSAVQWHVYDGDAVAKMYREAQNDTHREISFQRHVALPPISGANAAYLGVVRCKDYVQMIGKDAGELNKGLFFENVRDFLGTANTVNEEIARTIANADERDRFAILNNGVTLVAKQVTPSGDTFRISKFQVVNGCQTSHVLFNNRTQLTDDMYMTVKIIETSDVDLSGKVIATTNSQSLVTKEAFATIRPYHRSLEDFFSAMRSLGYSYFYERRPHQYDDRDDIRQSQIVSAPSLIKSFVSVVLEEPHKVHYYYGTLLSEYNSKQSSELFADDDYPGLYFAAHHISALARAASLKNPEHSNWAFHLALLVKRHVAPELRKEARLTDKNFLDLVKRIDGEFPRAYRASADLIKRLKFSDKENRAPETTKAMLKELVRPVRAVGPSPKQSGSERAQPPHLKDGVYVCVIEAIDASKGRVVVKYGPFEMEASVNLSMMERLRRGGRVQFNIVNGVATPYVATN
jgi:hypothetical protein